jgi:hypothetical protein
MVVSEINLSATIGYDSFYKKTSEIKQIHNTHNLAAIMPFGYNVVGGCASENELSG